MSTTRSQKRKNTQREVDDNVSEGFVSPINMENSCLLDQNVELAGPSRPKSPRVENSFLERIRSSLKEEITSEIRALLLESQKEMLKLLGSETKENARDEASEELGNETRNLYTPTKTVRINPTQNEDPSIIRNRKLWVQHRKIQDSAGKPWFGTFSAIVYRLFSRLSRGAAFLTFALQFSGRYFVKSMLRMPRQI